MSFPTEPSNNSITGLMAGNHSRDESLADLDGPSHSQSAAGNNNNPQEPGEPKKMNLTALVDRVRQVQKSDPGALQAPVQETHSAAQHPESPHHQHWYSNLMSHYRSHDGSEGSHHHHNNHHHESSSSSAQPPKPLSTVDQVANMFTAAGRTDNNLVSIDSSVSSLAIVGASAPAFLFQRDDKGRRPYGDLKWVIRRSLYEFYKLHLTLSRHNSNLPRFPNQVSWAVSMAKAGLGWSTASDDDLVRETNRARRKALQDYLLKVLQELKGTVVYDLYEFLEISAMSLTKDMGWKGKEGHVETKVIDTSRTLCGIPIGFNEYTRSWAILRDSYLAFCPDMSVDECSDVFIFDQSFYVKHKENILGFNMHHIEIGDSRRKIEMKGEHNREMVEWMEFFHKMQQSSPWVKTHRYGSFAPEREDAKVRYYVDGKDYFHAVSDAILAAKDEIYIADWWLSPELYLRRPPEKNEDFRLDRLLQRKAQEGVKIYIVVYKEVSVALTLDSAHTKTWLQDLHPNIQVQRHPDHISVTATQFWAHHEARNYANARKICVIDCRLAFIGGLDLCFGRYDSRTHQLADYHPSGNGTIWPGQDYSNPRIRDFANVKEYNTDLIERKLLGRMPWHDVSIGVAGKPARDIARHFVQRWNFVKREKGMKKSHMKFLTPKGEFVSTRDESGWTGTQKVQLLRSSTTWSQGVDLEHSIQTAYLNNIENAEHFIYIENQFFVTLATENGNPDLKNTIGIAIVNRIIKAHNEGKKFRVIVVMPLMPAFEADIMSSEAGTLRKVMHFQYVSICRGGNSIMERLEANGINPDQYIGFFGLRSFDRIKHGKFDAIVEAVKEAELEAAEQPTETAPAQDAPQQNQRVEFEDQHGQAKNRDLLKVAAGGELGRKKSLATKFLLDPIPRDKEAERLKAISARRKARDHERTWDESITKRAMGMSKKEHGYVPATTEKSMSNKRLSEKIRQQTLQKEREAKANQYQGGTTDNSEPHRVEGLGTNVRSAVEEAKGPKEHGGLDPPKDVVTPSSTPADSVRSGDAKVSILQKVKDLKNTIESVVEPSPPSSDGDAGSSQPKSDGGDADDKTENDVDNFVTEQLYIHSKLMIVDDRIIIIGSANINDRSQVGFRDSEIAIVIEDTDMVPSKMNGVEYKAGRLAHALRTDLFKEHLGLLPHVEHDVVTKASVLPVDLDAPTKDPEQARQELIAAAREENQSAQNAHSRLRGHLQVSMPNEEEAKAFQQWHAGLAQGQAKDDAAKDAKTADQIVMDPLHDDFYESWWKRVANQNTEIFREVFHCVPDQTVQTWDDYKAFVPDSKKVLTGHVAMPGATVENVTEKLQGVTGHLVEFPTKFLCKESLLGGVVDNAVTPMEIFT
ncbi:hypothetical protein BGZ80_004721 [Entomortierella chlamydospora]|uniref:Phospholipase n=1 Tax=Entomortierella chlamydospora TaxID=101097 RepID=A0A9P6N0I9_9FUNG|nr:hypothetical protein BGZ80_004721 [Entomortierella chlamydospora]